MNLSRLFLFWNLAANDKENEAGLFPSRIHIVWRVTRNLRESTASELTREMHPLPDTLIFERGDNKAT